MNKIFETEQLIIRTLSLEDATSFFDLMSNSNVIKYTPSPVLNKKESDAKLRSLMNGDHKFWAVTEKNHKELIGIAGLKIQSDEEAEIAYSLREKFWRKGYGTEIARGLINYGFGILNYTRLTAYADLKNTNSLKILDKFMLSLGEVYSQAYQCMDMKYQVNKENWKETI